MENSLHQQLMNSAYGRQSAKVESAKEQGQELSWSYQDMLSEATEPEKIAVLLGNLNYQVENGGIGQWVSNGYCTQYPHVIEAIEEIPSKHQNFVRSMVEALDDCLEDWVKSGDYDSNGCGGSYFVDEEEEVMCEECCGAGEIENPDYDEEDEDSEEMIECCVCMGSGEVTEQVDEPTYNDKSYAYYKINDEWMKDVEAYLHSHTSKETKEALNVECV